MIHTETIPPSRIEFIWSAIEEWVKSALGNDKSHTSDDVRRSCESGAVDLRIVYANEEIKGFLTYKIYDAPQCKCCYAPWLGGIDLAQWVPEAFEEFKAFLKEQNVQQYSFSGRDAWKRFIKADYEGRFYLITL